MAAGVIPEVRAGCCIPATGPGDIRLWLRTCGPAVQIKAHLQGRKLGTVGLGGCHCVGVPAVRQFSVGAPVQQLWAARSAGMEHGSAWWGIAALAAAVSAVAGTLEAGLCRPHHVPQYRLSGDCDNN